MVSSCAW